MMSNDETGIESKEGKELQIQEADSHTDELRREQIMVKLTVENEEVKKEINSRFVFAVAADLEDGEDGAIALLGPTSPRELAETVGKSIGAQFKYLTGDISSQIKLCKILSEAAIIAVFGNDIRVEKVEVDIKECGETSAED